MPTTIDKIKTGIGRGLGKLKPKPRHPRYDFDLEAGIEALRQNPNIKDEDFAIIAAVPVDGSGKADPGIVANRRAMALRELYRRNQQQQVQPAQPSAPASPAPPPPGPDQAGQMTPEQRLEQVSFDLPAHRRFLNRVKNLWRISGPVAFVVFTAWEVYYFINHFMQADGSLTTRVLLWGITLLIEVPFMIATYDQSERKQVRAEKRALGQAYRDPDQVASIIAWGFLALVNVAGQVAFLAFITRLGDNPFSTDPRVLWLWFFIVVRVLGVLMGDSYTAFFLRPDETTVERVLRAQSAQAKGRVALRENQAEIMRIDAESEAKVRRIVIAVRKEEKDSDFLTAWNDMNMKQTLERQRRFMERELQQYKIEEIKGPEAEANTDQLKGL